MNSIFFKFLFLLSFIPFLLLSNKKKDIQAIKGMCGCMDIKFQFAETFSPDKEYKFYENYNSGGRELAFVVEETKDKIVIQHLLVVGKEMVIKHWRQDWVYQTESMLSYDKEERWVKKNYNREETKGKWIQKVYQVDDSPRYEGMGSWVHVDGKSYWESTTDAPLPRREYSKRKDYNVLSRRNRHNITDFGWVHEQDNLKILRGENIKLIAEEKGKNTYVKVGMEKCEPALKWWDKNQNFWSIVRKNWDNYFEENEIISFHKSVNKQPMFNGFFALGKKYEGLNNVSEKQYKEINDEINNHISSFIKP